MTDLKKQGAAILGGGPSLPADINQLPPDCALIAVNNHAYYPIRHCTPDFMVYMDDPQKAPDLAAALREFQGTIVSPFRDSHVTLPKGQYYDGGFTSALAVWFALWLDYDPVILCGMDCYQGAEKYCHPRPGFDHPVLHYPLENHLRAWRIVAKHVPHPERIRAMSGPLVTIFGAYDGTTI
ncbi:MAG: hypothetical protein HY867_06125 [Chloroflexi bacterium]|nr:hypothetical protein [Chloroflexota bacterium]